MKTKCKYAKAGNIPPKIGSRFSWETLGGKWYSGIVIDIDNSTIIVKLDDGTVRAC